MTKKICLSLIVFIAMMLWDSSWGQSSEQRQLGSVLRWAETVWPSSPDGLTSEASSEIRLSHLIFSPLFRREGRQHATSVLAKRIDQPYEDKRRVIVELRDNIYWEDAEDVAGHGTRRKLDSNDVKKMLHLMLNPDTDNHTHPEIWHHILGETYDEKKQSIKVISSNQLEIHFARVLHGDPKLMLDFLMLPEHKLHDTDALQREGLNLRHDLTGVGTGPFKIADIQFDELKIILERRAQPNPLHNGHAVPPKLYGMEMNASYREIGLALTALGAGKEDVVPDCLLKFVSAYRGGTRIDTRNYDSNRFYYIGFNYRTGGNRARRFFHDLLFREILQMATKKDALLGVYTPEDGSRAGTVIHSPFTSQHLAGTALQVQNRLTDDELSTRLDKLGFQRNPRTGVREKEGIPLKYRLEYPLYDSYLALVADKFQKRMMRIGVQVTLPRQELNRDGIDKLELRHEWRRWDTLLHESHDFDMVLYHYEYPPHSEDATPFFEPGRRENVTGYADAVLSDLITRYRQATDERDIIEFLKKMHQHITEQQPVIFLFNLPHQVVYNPEVVSGMEIDPYYFFKNIEQWSVRRSQ